MSQTERILVIKLGALGDVVQATGPFKAIRDHHRDAHITLLTTTPFASFLAASGWFDQIELDTKPKLTNVSGILALRSLLRHGRFTRVYDLQTSDRSSFYRRLFWPDPAPEWSGIAAGASHPHANPKRDDMHTVDRQRDQLAMAGIADVPAPDLCWVTADVTGLGLKSDYALLVPGGSAHRPSKRWPADRYGLLAKQLVERDIQPVLVGTKAEAGELAKIMEICPWALDLGGQTDLAQLAALARGARFAVGNDSGPMHMAAAAGCRSVVLFSAESKPALCAPRSRDPESVRVLRQADLSKMTIGEVSDSLRDWMTSGKSG